MKLCRRISLPLLPRLLSIAVAIAVATTSSHAAADPKPAVTLAPSAAGAGHWQTPGEIQQPKGTWQVPGEIQKPGEIRRVEEKCRHRLVVSADALFPFDFDTITPQAEATLGALGPQLAAEKGAISVEGHTDSKGSDDYNQSLSERRARAVRDWLVAHHHVAAGTTAVGYGESKPIAPNAKPDGGDDPEGRAKNRRVEVVVATCPG